MPNLFCDHRSVISALAFTLLLALAAPSASRAQGLIGAPDRKENEGAGPFEKLVIKDAIIIDGTGAPPNGPLNVLIEGNRITRIGRGISIDDADHVIDAKGMYLMPGFVDMHAHAGSRPKAPEAEYVYKLWLAHGVTTVRGVPLGPNDWTVKEKERSERNEIVAPRIVNYQRPGNIQTAEEAREWVREAPVRGIDGLKLGSYPPEVMAALLDEAKRHGLGSTAHLAQTGVAQMNAIDAARLGLGTVTHFYGHFESLLKDHVVQPYPVDHNYSNEQDRFGQVARLWNQIHEPGSEPWKAYLQEHLELGTTFDPTMTIYAAGRDVMRARNADWHDKYTLPTLFQYFEPSLENHGSYWFYWTTWEEVAWRNFYHVWMQLINDYKKMGGRVTVGSDSGFIYKTYGFGYIEELELLQEAGFHPLEVIQSATMNGALTITEPTGKPLEFGLVRQGFLADLILVEENPLANLKVLYGTGARRLNQETGEVDQVGGVRWTIKDGIIYDAKQLLADVAEMVEAQKRGPAEQNDKPEASSPSVDKPQVSPPRPPKPSVQGISVPLPTGESRQTTPRFVSRDATNQLRTEADNPTKSPQLDSVQTGDGYFMVWQRELKQVAVFNIEKSSWSQLSIEDELSDFDLIVSPELAYLKTKTGVYAYSGEQGKWDYLELPDGPVTIDVQQAQLLVKTSQHVSVFAPATAKWNSLRLGSMRGDSRFVEAMVTEK